MSGASNLRTGGRLLIDQLVVHGVDAVFCVPGESYLTALDAFHDVQDRIRLITCRHEAAAANMAEAYGKMTGRPGVCFVTRGPGACHAAVGLHTAFQDSTPLILFVGQVARGMTEREAFQEMDFRRFFGQASKWAAEIEDAARIPELVSHAFHTATAGRPGPVALSLPEDMLTDDVGVADAGPYKIVQAHPGPDDMATLRRLLQSAKRPLAMLGGATWTAQAVADIARFVEAFDLPVTTSFRNQDRFDHRHPNYVGEVGIGSNPKLIQRIKDSDLLLLIGPRLGEQTSQGYTLIDLPRPKQTVVHVHPGAEELGRVFQADLPIVSGMAAFAAAAAKLEPLKQPAWSAAVKQGRAEYLDNIEIEPSTGALDMAHVTRVLRDRLPKDAVLANDAGNFAGWAHRYLQFTRYPSQVGPTNGAMGYGLPAALGACVAAPDRPVVCFAGDGGFLMSGSELATAVHHDLKPLVLVVNNGMYGTIRMHQEREHPGRYPGTALTNPDFAAYARSFGAFGETVTKNEEFEGALERALASGKCALLELRTDPEAITTRTTLTAIRNAAIARRKG
jgi:acetolactate synthase I/II/III large subunit